MPQDPFFEQPLGQYAPAVANRVARTAMIFTIVSLLSSVDWSNDDNEKS